MARRVNSFRANSRVRSAGQVVRVITTALVERDGYLLLTQLAAGRFAGFWLLPSATAEEGTVEQTSLRMVWERTGYPVLEQQLVSVIEEPKPGVLALRFLFRSRVGERDAAVSDPEIAQTRWFSRAAVREVLAERDVVPNLGVMSVLRAWAEGATPRPLELLVEDTPCPCGTGFGYRGCCGWDAR